jgi:hypothetical protein
MKNQYVIVELEPSNRLSELCGFPYFIQRRFTLSELLEKNIINLQDIEQMEQGKEIHKKLRVTS